MRRGGRAQPRRIRSRRHESERSTGVSGDAVRQSELLDGSPATPASASASAASGAWQAILDRTLLDVSRDELGSILADLSAISIAAAAEDVVGAPSGSGSRVFASVPAKSLARSTEGSTYFPTTTTNTTAMHSHSATSAPHFGHMRSTQNSASSSSMQSSSSHAVSQSTAGASSFTVSDPVRASVGHLLTQACTMPCNAAAQAFAQLVQPTARFQLALDALLPLLESDRAELAQRILVSYILYALYAPHPLSINPFRDAMSAAFARERAVAISPAHSSNDGSTLETQGQERDQLVWVLWKILRGDGNDIGPYSPNTLARSPLPAKLRPINLVLDESSGTPDGISPAPPSRASAFSPLPTGSSSRTPPASNEDSEVNAAIANAMSLLLAARERTLSISEQRALSPHIAVLSAPSNRMVTPLDLPPLIANNPDVAYSLLVALLASPQSSSISSQASAQFSSSSSRLPQVYGRSGGFNRSSLSRGLSLNLSNTTPSFLNTLTTLPPTLATFDLLGRLLRDPTGLTISLPFSSNPEAADVQRTTVADVVRTEVLGTFVHNAVQWLERALVEEREGRVADDRFAQGVQNLCRFYRSLFKLGILDPSGQDTVEMQQFSLAHSRFDEARQLYSMLVSGGPLAS